LKILIEPPTLTLPTTEHELPTLLKCLTEIAEPISTNDNTLIDDDILTILLTEIDEPR
jgi:hypothetical protein